MLRLDRSVRIPLKQCNTQHLCVLDQVVAVISAMKMEMAVQSQVTGVVRATHVAVGDKIDPEDLLVEVEEEQQ